MEINMKEIWIDLETTGLNPDKDTIIEIACIFPTDKGDDIFHKYCLPDEKPENFQNISKLTGITWEFLEENGFKEDVLFSLFLNWLDGIISKYNKNDKAILCGYNVLGFDSKFLRKLFYRNCNNFYGSYFYSPSFDVFSKIAEELKDENIPQLPSYNLKSCCDFFNIDFMAHSAIADIQATIELYKKLKGE